MNTTLNTPTPQLTLEQRVADLETKLEQFKNVVTTDKEILNSDEASLFLGISKSTLHKMTHHKMIPYYKPNNKMVFFERTELLALLRKNHVSAK